MLVAAQGVGVLGVGVLGDWTDPAPVGPRLEEASRHQLNALQRSSRAALLVAAASWSGGLAGIAGALRVTGAHPRILEQLEANVLILVGGGRVALPH